MARCSYSTLTCVLLLVVEGKVLGDTEEHGPHIVLSLRGSEYELFLHKSPHEYRYRYRGDDRVFAKKLMAAWLVARNLKTGEERTIWRRPTGVGDECGLVFRDAKRVGFAFSFQVLAYFYEFDLSEDSIPVTNGNDIDVRPLPTDRLPPNTRHRFNIHWVLRKAYPDKYVGKHVQFAGAKLRSFTWKDGKWQLRLTVNEGTFLFVRFDEDDHWTVDVELSEPAEWFLESRRPAIPEDLEEIRRNGINSPN